MAVRTGFVALIGKPNVGKSTLLNALVGQKVSIVSSKPQTTRRKVIGFAQDEGYQVAFVDTPGVHEPHDRLGRAMVQQARGALADVDVAVAVVDVSRKPDAADEALARLVIGATERRGHRVVCLNKMDLLPPEHVAARVEAFTKLFQTEDYMFTDAAKRRNLDKLLDMILQKLPVGEPIAPEDEFTDQSARFLVAELIREKAILLTRQEVPHSTAVRVDLWEDQLTDSPAHALGDLPAHRLKDRPLHIAATILVERQGQRAILVGKRGEMIKRIGTEARADIEGLLGRHVFLELHVSVREGWRTSADMLRDLEYVE